MENKALLSSAVLIGIGGATGVHENSIVLDGSSLYVAAGDALYSLSLPTLELNWCEQVDLAACFGVFLLPNRDCLLTCGELEIGCYSKAGEKLWGSSGGDIFTGEIEIKNNMAEVSDFIGDTYEIDLHNGKIVNIRS
ncbi:hypothetical protein [Sessilibacter corallicola]|uniref:hypothetical protein n=1 Tax=Sessilibacter corallicola TaxID=2904075 RepID=UPI001E51454E|nr:hypothetical protein [Sessilibacter corallicola]MCE2029498.1 hypothetical protein [Sessilibacter corallicola]